MLSLYSTKESENVAIVKSDNILINNKILCTDEENENPYKNIFVSDGELFIYPRKTAERLYIAGPSGSGKSWQCGIYCENYNKMYPKNQIVIFTPHEKDEAYAKVKNLLIMNINDNSLYEEPINIIKFSNKLVIFDDCDNVQDKKARIFLDGLEKDLIMNSRKYNTYMISLVHMMCDGQSTRHKIAEATRTIFFPNAGSTFHIKRYLTVYGGLDKSTLEKVLNLKSRWVCFSNVSPQYILYNRGCFLIK